MLKVSFFKFNLLNSFIITVVLSFLQLLSLRDSFVVKSLIILGAYLTSLLLFHLFWLIFFKRYNPYKWFVFAVYIIGFTSSYFTYKYNSSLDAFFVINIFTELKNIREVVNIKDVSIILLVGIPYFFFIRKLAIIKNIYLSKKQTLIIALSLILIYIVASFSYKNITRENVKFFSRVTDLNKRIFDELFYFSIFKVTADIIGFYLYDIQLKFFPPEKISPKDLHNLNNDNIKVIVVISDSIRTQSMQMFGYHIPNNPKLMQNIKVGNIIKIQAVSCATTSLQAMSCMLSLQKGEQFRKNKKKEYKYSRIINYMGFLGFKSYLLYNNYISGLHFGYDNVFSNSTFEDKDGVAYDTAVIKYLPNILQQKGRQFITIILDGAHANYSQKLLPEFKKFPKDYDNKILQTDTVWTNVIKDVKDLKEPVFLILTSDHGESFGEVYNGRKYTFHGAKYEEAPPEQTSVPLLIYVNDAYKKQYPKNYTKLKKYDKTKNFSNDYISNSLLGCAGIKGAKIDETLNICAGN